MNLRSEGHYLAAILFKRGKLYDALEMRYPRFMKLLRRFIDSNQCPFCRRQFATKFALYKHLKQSACGAALYKIVDLLAERVDEDQLLRWVT